MQDIHVFDFDGSVTCQARLMQQFSAQITVSNLNRFRNAARLWTSPKKFKAIQERMKSQPCFSFLGSGDYHHFSLALIQQYQEPVTVVLFDNHPDWMRPPHQYHCGTWVYTLARLAHVKRIIIVGLESGDIDGSQFSKGDVESYLQGKIVLLPYRPVNVALSSADTATLSSQLVNNTVAGINEILQAIPTEHVYISLDKDCLREQDAYTNWEQGTLPLDTVLQCIQAICNQFKVIGADTVGDYSPPRFFSPLKWIGSLLDRPKYALNFSKNSALLARNELANIALLNILCRHA